MLKSGRSAILITAAIILITILIPLLSDTDFHGGIPPGEDRFSRSDGSQSYLDSFIGILESNRLWNSDKSEYRAPRLLALMLIPIPIIALLVISVLMLISVHLRKKILTALIGWVIIIFAFYIVFIFSYNRPMEDHWKAGALIREEVPVQQSEIIAVEESLESDISRGVSFLFTFIVLLLLGIIIFLFYRKMQSFNRESDEISIKDVTEQALNSFKDEQLPISDIIIRCYNNMVVCLLEERGISRSDSMTAGEFKVKLRNVGLPQNEVEKLTSLFERVRYGREPLSKKDEKEAEICLKSVVAALESENE